MYVAMTEKLLADVTAVCVAVCVVVFVAMRVAVLEKLTSVVTADAAAHGQVGVHFFSFGSLERTALWATQRFGV